MRKVTVIGAGNVGSTIAYTLAVEGVANEIVMIDIRADKAVGEAMDISQASPFFTGARVVAGSYEDAVDSDIVIITSGMGRKPGQTRLDLAQTNVNILCQIAPQITKYAPNAIYVIVSNPVDVMTYVFHKVTNIPYNRILGSAYCVIFWIQNIGLLLVPIVIGAVNDATGSYVVPMIIFSSFGVAALFIGMLLKREDSKKGYGLELPNIKE